MLDPESDSPSLTSSSEFSHGLFLSGGAPTISLISPVTFPHCKQMDIFVGREIQTYQVMQITIKMDWISNTCAKLLTTTTTACRDEMSLRNVLPAPAAASVTTLPAGMDVLI